MNYFSRHCNPCDAGKYSTKPQKIVFSAMIFSAMVFLVKPSVSLAVDIDQYPVLVKLVEEMTAQDGYPREQLNRVLKQANIQQTTIDLMNRRIEALPWYKYRKIFLNQNRIEQGVKFWNENRLALDRAYQKFGVPQAVIVALIGIETDYGTYMGNKRVLDSLVTLSAEYPRRSTFFTSELRTFLNITRKENIDPASVMGSFAGAIGIPQFMPTSYAAYSVDFNGNNQRDLINETDDAIGSVANYLKSHGWNHIQPIYASVTGPLSESAAKLVSGNAKLVHTPKQLIAAGVKFDADRSSDKIALMSLQERQGNRYIVGFRNFYAITRYNPSVNYAMATAELADSIVRARNND